MSVDAGLLPFVTTGELVDELLGRCDAVVIATYEWDKRPGVNVYRRRSRGDHKKCLQLCATMAQTIQKEMHRSAQEGDSRPPTG